MSSNPSNFVTPSANRSGGDRTETRTNANEEEQNEPEYDGFSSLNNPFFRDALESNNNPVLCLENYFASIHDATHSASGSTTQPTVTPGPNEPAAKRHASDVSNKKIKAPSSSTQTQFKFRQVSSTKQCLEMSANILNEDNVVQKYKAVALAVNNAHALVGVEINGRMVPTTCERESLPSPVIKVLEELLATKGKHESFRGVVDKVGQCQDDKNPTEEYFCILDEESPFKGYVVEQGMLQFLKKGMVKYERKVQGNGKKVCNFLFSTRNLSAGRLLNADEVKHIARRQPPRFSQGNPALVHELAQLAKMYFMMQGRSRKVVFETLEKARNSASTPGWIDNESLHSNAVQIALGGNISDIAAFGRFVKCPVQMERARKDGGVALCWSDTPCCCNLTEALLCPEREITKRFIGHRKSAHDRNQTDK